MHRSAFRATHASELDRLSAFGQAALITGLGAGEPRRSGQEDEQDGDPRQV